LNIKTYFEYNITCKIVKKNLEEPSRPQHQVDQIADKKQFIKYVELDIMDSNTCGNCFIDIKNLQ